MLHGCELPFLLYCPRRLNDLYNVILTEKFHSAEMNTSALDSYPLHQFKGYWSKNYSILEVKSKF